MIGDVLLPRLETSVLEDYAEVRFTDDDAGTGTVGNEISTIVQAWRWGLGRGLVPQRQLVRPRIKHKFKLSRYIPDLVEFWMVWNAIPDNRAWARTMLVIMEATGARSGEVADMTWADISWSRKRVRLDGKTGERWVRLSDRALEWLEAVKPEVMVGRILTVSRTTAIVDLREVLQQCCKTAGVPYFQPKQVRAMVENRLYDAGGDPDAVAQFMGHTPEVSLRNYRKAKKRRINEILDAAGIGERPDGDKIVSLADHRRKRKGS